VPGIGSLPIELVKSARPAAGSLLIAAGGVYGGQFASKFIPPFDWYASGLCVLAMIIGLTIAVAAAAYPVIGLYLPHYLPGGAGDPPKAG